MTGETIVWRREDLTAGLGTVRLERAPDGWVAHGAEVAVDGDRRWAVAFQVEADEFWHTRSANVRVTADEGIREIHLEADGAGSWRRNGAPVPALDGCLDVDIAATPFTNTLPIRRLALSVGQQASIQVAWLGVPELELECAEQAYEHVGERTPGEDGWDYILPDGTRCALIVDSDGIVTRYEGFATRLSG